MGNSRRTFLHQLSALTALGLAKPWEEVFADISKELFEISLSQWSYHRAIFGDSRSDYAWFIKTLHSDPDAVLLGEMDSRDIVVRARAHGVDAVDYVNVLFFGHAQDWPWLSELKNRADGEGVKSLMIMCDEAGRLGAADPADRQAAIDEHLKWLETAKFLGCHSIRVNGVGDGTYLEQLGRTGESLRTLCDAADDMEMNILVENHGESSNIGAWLAMLVESVSHPRLKVLADFDNFFMGGWNVDPPRLYDRYQGLMDLAPYTTAVSAKAHGFDAQGNEVKTDFAKALRILLEAGFRGYASIEYEGDGMTEDQGVAATKELLERVRADLTPEFSE